MYTIKDYSYKQAKKLNVQIRPSTNPKKKLDVYTKDNNFICSIGSIDYSDYPTYLETKGKDYADNRRRLYKIRHEKNRKKEGTPSFWADNLLW
jgi:hypothetical protein